MQETRGRACGVAGWSWGGLARGMHACVHEDRDGAPACGPEPRLWLDYAGTAR